MITSAELLDRVREYAADADVAPLARAHELARSAGGDALQTVDLQVQRPLAAAQRLAELRLDVDTLAAALLYPVVDEGRLDPGELRRDFGGEIADIVEGAVRIDAIQYRSGEDEQAEAFRKMVFAMARDLRSLLVKIADRLVMLDRLAEMAPQVQRRIARETMDLYAPIANRLGIQTFKAQLEDRSFAVLYPDVYRRIERELSQRQQLNRAFMARIEEQLRHIAAAHDDEPRVYGRLKHYRSIYRKMLDKRLDLDELADLVAFRVLVEDVAACYAVLGDIHARWEPVEGRFKDYISREKANGYQSLHTAVLGPDGEMFEVQIRTHEMHRVAEFGIAAHWRYKEGHLDLSADQLERYSRVRQLIRIATEVEDDQEFVQLVRADLFADEVYVTTPMGDVRWFPRGATALDFAYSIHSEVGNRCVGARIDGQMVPLRHELESGDRVEILTRKGQKPSRDWMRWVVTPRARSKIRAVLQTEAREEARRAGCAALERELKARDVKLSRLARSPEFARVLERLKARTADELYTRLGYGSMPLERVVDLLAPRAEADDEVERAVLDTPSPQERASRGEVRVHGLDGMLTNLARCCRPVPGDAVIGYITRGRGVTVHRSDCAQARRLDQGRLVPVDWIGSRDDRQDARIQVVMEDRSGMLAEVTRRIGLMKINIVSCDVRVDADGFGTAVIGLSVRDVEQLELVLNRLGQLKGVLRAARL